MHAGVDEAGFVYRQSMTPGNVHDSQERDILLLGDESALYTDPVYEVGEDEPKGLLEGKSAQLIINTGNSSEVLEENGMYAVVKKVN